jgi:hypothetical protein
MADDSDNTGLGLIVGILAAVLVVILALGVGPRFFRGQPSDVNVTIEAPKVPAVPAAPKG